MKTYVLAHDLGTSGNKATLYDPSGRMVESAFHGYDTEYAHTGWAEQNPDDWWNSACAALRDLLECVSPARIAARGGSASLPQRLQNQDQPRFRQIARLPAGRSPSRRRTTDHRPPATFPGPSASLPRRLRSRLISRCRD